MPAALLIASDKTARLRPIGIAAACTQLAELLAIYGDGLTRLVPFYPRTSHEWVRAERSSKDPTRAARGAWVNDGFGGIGGESEDAYVALAVRGEPDPLGEEFRALAR